jgi:RNA polymerase sigma-70 factor (ECF subfamily)
VRADVDEDEWTAVFDAHYAAVHRYVARRAGRAVADDLAAETFLVAFRERDRFVERGAGPRPWLYGIATNLLRRARRDEERYLRALARAGGPTDAPDVGDASAARAAVVGALLALAPEERDALLLHGLAGLSYAECAAATGVPEGTVASRISRARTRVRAGMEKEGERGRA